MATEISFIAAGFVIGAALASLILYIILSKKISFFEGKAGSSDAVNGELRKQNEDLERKLEDVRTDLQYEKEIRAASEARYHETEKNLLAMEKELLDKFKSLSSEALDRSSETFLKLAGERLKSQTIEGTKELEVKKDLIDNSLKEMDKTLSEVKMKIEDVGKGNIEVSTLIKKHEDITLKLKDTADHLRQALASSKKRGEWGERMAEDIINLVGMVEGVNYTKQKTLDSSSGRPDYTFLMPNKLKINMDVKFPLDNYIHYLDAQTDHDRKRYRDELLKNTKLMIKQVTTRDYINPADNTVDYVLIFIPNEQVYGFLNESDLTLMDEALKQKVVLCSPFTLYAVLAVIRQAIENFSIEKTASEMIQLLGDFSKQWKAYKDKFRVMGERLDSAKKEYDLLTTTRVNQLERPLRKIDDLRKQNVEPIDSDAAGLNDTL